MTENAPNIEAQIKTDEDIKNNVVSLVTDDTSDVVKIEVKDGIVIVDRDTAWLCNSIRKQLKKSDDNAEKVITISNVTQAAVIKVMEWCRFHCPPQNNNVNSSSVKIPSPRERKLYNKNFVNTEPGKLCELASASYYLDIKPLVDLTCQAIAKLIKGKSPEEVRQTFNIQNDFEPEEEAAIAAQAAAFRFSRKRAWHLRKKQTTQKTQDLKSDQKEDTRSIEELLSYIMEGDEEKSKKKKNNKKQIKKQKSKKKSKKRSIEKKNEMEEKDFDEKSECSFENEENNSMTTTEDDASPVLNHDEIFDDEVFTELLTQIYRNKSNQPNLSEKLANHTIEFYQPPKPYQREPSPTFENEQIINCITNNNMEVPEMEEKNEEKENVHTNVDESKNDEQNKQSKKKKSKNKKHKKKKEIQVSQQERINDSSHELCQQKIDQLSYDKILLEKQIQTLSVQLNNEREERIKFERRTFEEMNRLKDLVSIQQEQLNKLSMIVNNLMNKEKNKEPMMNIPSEISLELPHHRLYGMFPQKPIISNSPITPPEKPMSPFDPFSTLQRYQPPQKTVINNDQSLFSGNF